MTAPRGASRAGTRPPDTAGADQIGPLRVLLLAQWYDPVIGGEEVQVRTLAQSLAARGHAVSVVALSHPERPSEYWDGPVRVHRVRATTQRLPVLFTDPARQSAPPFPDPGIASAVRRIVRQQRPDIVHAHNWIVHSYLPVRDPDVPLVLTLHDHSLSCAKKVLLFREVACSGPAPMKCLRCASGHYGPVKGPVTLGGLWASRSALVRATDCFIGVSQSVIDMNFSRGSETCRVAIPNFLADGFVEAADRPPAGIPAEPFILFVGSLARFKGIHVLLEAFGRLESPTRPPLVLLGYTGTESVEDLGEQPAGVTIVTDQPRAAVAATWRRSLFGVVPSIGPETFGLVALEAMAMGRPVIASRIGGLQELVRDGETGLLVPPGDATELALAMDRLLRDVGLRDRMARAAEVRARDYSSQSIVPQIEDLYRQLITRRRAGRVRQDRRAQGPGSEALTRR